jgi:hypothetical protein
MHSQSVERERSVLEKLGMKWEKAHSRLVVARNGRITSNENGTDWQAVT